MATSKNEVIIAIEYCTAEMREQEYKLMNVKSDLSEHGTRARQQARHNLAVLNTIIEVLKEKRDWF